MPDHPLRAAPRRRASRTTVRTRSAWRWACSAWWANISAERGRPCALAVLGEASHERGAVLQAAQRGPQRRLDRAALRLGEAVERVEVADVAAPLQDALRPALGQDAPALGAHEGEVALLRRRPDRRVAGPHVVGKRRAVDERGDRVRDERSRRDGVDGDLGDRVGRHARVERVLGVLHDGGAALGLDDREAGRAVVPGPGQHDARPRRDRARARRTGRACRSRGGGCSPAGRPSRGRRRPPRPGDGRASRRGCGRGAEARRRSLRGTEDRPPCRGSRRGRSCSSGRCGARRRSRPGGRREAARRRP